MSIRASILFFISASLVVASFTTWAASADSTRTDSSVSESNKRLRYLIAAEGIAYGGAMTALYTTWYKDYPRSDFRVFNDNSEWMQMDKVGHFSSAYALAYWNSSLFRWAGLSNRQSAWAGAASSLFFLTSVEFFDAYSAEWGFSPGDVLSNTLGASLFLAQELAWNEQRFMMKFSYQQDPLSKQRPELFGSGLPEQVLKDYNGQTYWLSCNFKSIGLWKSAPPWLNLALGYGASGMTGAYDGENRQRQLYLSPDVYWSRIPVKRKWQRTVLKILDVVKLPAPALLWDSSGKTSFKGLAF